MKAFEAIKYRKSCQFYGTTAGKQSWQALSDHLKKKAEGHRAILAQSRSREHEDPLDEQRELDLTVRSFNHAEHVLHNFTIIEPATNADLVDIGTVVTYQQYDAKGKPVGTPVTVQVGEYGCEDIHANPRVVAYDNRILLQLLGCRKGAVESIRLANSQENEFEILDIRLPAQYPQLKLVA